MAVGVSIREYARQRGISDAAVRKALKQGRITAEADGTIDVERADRDWLSNTAPASRKPRTVRAAKTKPVPAAAVKAVEETLEESGSSVSGELNYMQVKTASEVLKVQEGKIRLAKLKGDLIEQDKAVALVFRLAREERDAWVNWPARVAAMMAAELGTQTAVMQKVLEAHVRAHLDELAEPRIEFV